MEDLLAKIQHKYYNFDITRFGKKININSKI